MQVLRLGRDLERFFERLARYPGRPLLLLDYDGTLAPFRKERDKAVPYPGIVDALTALQETTRTRLVIITGRSVHDVLRLLQLKSYPEIWGSHGWERQLASGEYSLATIDSQAQCGLEIAYDAAEEIAGAEHCERKPAGVALHWRGVNPATVKSYKEKTIERWKTISGESGLALHYFDGGVELRVPGRDKGAAVKTLLSEMGMETPVAYLGDDATDEDAFAAVGDLGISVLVRPEYRSTGADMWLRPPEELLDFLAKWRAAARPE